MAETADCISAGHEVHIDVFVVRSQEYNQHLLVVVQVLVSGVSLNLLNDEVDKGLNRHLLLSKPFVLFLQFLLILLLLS